MRVEDTIVAKLEAGFAPKELQVENESSKHNVPKGSETHFKVLVVSEAFEGVRSVARHQMVFRMLKDELAGGVHALSITAQTPTERSANPESLASPLCMGGSKA